MDTKCSFTFALMISALLTGCEGDMCGNEISQSIISPSGSYIAYVFSRNCGATTGFNTQVSVLPSTSKPPSDSGNLYINSQQFPVQLQWQSDKVLKISGAISSSTIKQLTTIEGVNVLYEP
jgi:hypothetical protein